MFDSVYLRCPECGTPTEFQSKAGACELMEYTAECVPSHIANDINGDVEFCPNCGNSVRAAIIQTTNLTVPMAGI